MAGANVYRIRVDGNLDPGWSAWFEGLVVDADADGTSALTGPLTDQAALHGLLARVRDLGLEIVSVERLGEEASADRAVPRSSNSRTEGAPR